MYLPRHITAKVERVAALYPVVLITGPRQVGKTELTKKLFPDHRYVLLDSPSTVGLAKTDSGEIRFRAVFVAR